MIISDTSGQSSITVLTVVILLTMLFLSASQLSRQSQRETGKLTEELQWRRATDAIAEQVLIQLSQDPTPLSHSKEDPVWSYLEQAPAGQKWTLEDISSKLNINWMRTQLLERTDLNQLIISTDSPDSIRERRSLSKFSTDLSDWEDVFGEENIRQYFGLYSWANINVSDEESLERLYRIRHGHQGAQAFRLNIQQGLKEKKLWTQEDLSTIMGFASDDLQPVINTMSLMNVHFIDPFLLKCLLSYPFSMDPLPNSQGVAHTILTLRESGEISPADLRAWIAPNENQEPLLQYLGTQTAFWQLTVAKENHIESYIYAYDGTLWHRL